MTTAYAEQTDAPGGLVIGGDFQGLGVLQSLGRRGVRTFLIDSDPCIGRFSRYRGKLRKCPDVRDEAAFLEFLSSLATREELRGWVIYPNNDETVKLLSRHKNELEGLYRVPVPAWDQVRLMYDKRCTYRLAEKVGVPTPDTYYPECTEAVRALPIDFPVIVKPAIRENFYRQTKRKAVMAETMDDLVSLYEWAATIVPASEIMIQDFIPAGPAGLFSLGALIDQGEIVAGVMARRSRQHPMDFGHATTFAETVNIPKLKELSAKMLRAAAYTGLAEVEFMLDPRDDVYKLIEINARVWGWHTLARAAGVDLPYLLYRRAVDVPAPDNGSFAEGVKWVRPITDLPTVAREILQGRMRVSDYVRSLKGHKELAPDLAWDDPLPFLMEVAMIPYLWKRRGF